jgi:phosphate transport system ATP-binding protein
MNNPSQVERPAGQVCGLTVSFGPHRVLKDVNIKLYQNRVHLLSGHSGSGKSTLLRALNRLNDCFDGCHTQGEIVLRLGGRSHQVNTLKPAALPDLRRRVGMVFQHPQLLPGSIADNLLLPLKVVAHLTGAVAQARAMAACQQAALWDEIKDRLEMDVASLSGGQQQRLCLARTLALEPEILLLDEPTASLDQLAAEQIEQCIEQLAQKYTIVMVSHSVRQSEKLADYIIRMHQGQVEYCRVNKRA